MQSFRRLLLLAAFFLAPFSLSASETITINPAFQEIVLPAGQNLPGEIRIENKTSANQEFTVRSVSFDALDKSGGVAFLGAEINNENLPPAEFLFFETEKLSIEPGQTGTFRFEVRDQVSLSPGGHYAALVFQSLPVIDEDAPQKVAVRSIFSSLIFLEKSGGARKELTLQEGWFEKPFSFTLPKALDLSFSNSGNTHLTPRGKVELQNIFGQTLSCGVINEASSLLLPGQERVFSTPLYCPGFSFGPSTFVVSYRFDGEENFTEATKSFTHLPQESILFVGALIILLLLLQNKGFFVRRKKR